ncbi:MAG TPA: hypothetical protein VFE04_08845, partial [Puia sp.]|nr:hypothetical protein [Puia sp.]
MKTINYSDQHLSRPYQTPYPKTSIIANKAWHDLLIGYFRPVEYETFFTQSNPDMFCRISFCL